MEKVKQVIVMRKDLNMRKGKMISQGSHASLKVFLDLKDESHFKMTGELKISLNDDMQVWISDKFTKICVSVNSEHELVEIYNKAKNSGLPCSLIEDCGLTEFKGEPTLTCCAIGPAKEEDIDLITGDLSLL